MHPLLELRESVTTDPHVRVLLGEQPAATASVPTTSDVKARHRSETATDAFFINSPLLPTRLPKVDDSYWFTSFQVPRPFRDSNQGVLRLSSGASPSATTPPAARDDSSKT